MSDKEFDDMPLVTMYLPLPINAVASIMTAMVESCPGAYVDNEGDDTRVVVIRQKKSDA